MKEDKAYMLAGIIDQLIGTHIDIQKHKSKGDTNKATFSDGLRKNTVLQLVRFLTEN